MSMNIILINSRGEILKNISIIVDYCNQNEKLGVSCMEHFVLGYIKQCKNGCLLLKSLSD